MEHIHISKVQTGASVRTLVEYGNIEIRFVKFIVIRAQPARRLELVRLREDFVIKMLFPNDILIEVLSLNGILYVLLPCLPDTPHPNGAPDECRHLSGETKARHVASR
jgi:hypothetical protein